MPPATKRGASTIAVLRVGRAELERAKQIEKIDDRRDAPSAPGRSARATMIGTAMPITTRGGEMA